MHIKPDSIQVPRKVKVDGGCVNIMEARRVLGTGTYIATHLPSTLDNLNC